MSNRKRNENLWNDYLFLVAIFILQLINHQIIIFSISYRFFENHAYIILKLLEQHLSDIVDVKRIKAENPERRFLSSS